MELDNWLPLIVSIISVFVSLYVGYRITRFNDASLKRSSRMDFTEILVELDQKLVDYPMLWTIYDSHPLSRIKTRERNSPLLKARREALIYLHFNLFDIVYDFYFNVIKKKRWILIGENKIDVKHWKSWDKYIKQFFKESSEARSIFKEKRTQEIYLDEFVAYINGIINKIDSEINLD